MTPDEIRTHPFFAKLTDRQQIFVDQLLQNGNDKVAAAHKAWNCGTDESARTLANRALQHEGVSYLVESYFGADVERVAFTRGEALKFLAKKARASKDEKLCLDYLKVIVAMEGWLVKAAEKAPEQPRSDDNDEFTLD